MNSPSGGETGTRAALARAAPLPQAEEALHEQAQQEPVPQPGRLEVPESFAAAVALVREQGEGILANHLMDDVHLVRYEPGRVDRKSVVSGKSVSVRVDLGGRRSIKKKQKI